MKRLYLVGLLILSLAAVVYATEMDTLTLRSDAWIFNTLGEPPDGTVRYCSDCTPGTLCTGSGNGVVALRENGVWGCGGEAVVCPTSPCQSGTTAPGTCTIGECFFDTDATAGNNVYGCTATNTWTLEGDGGGGGGTTKPFLSWNAPQAFLPSADFATFSTSNIQPTLDFASGGTPQCAYFGGVLPPAYAGGGLTVGIQWHAVSGTSGSVTWETAFERFQDGVNQMHSDSFASAESGTSAAPGTAGFIKYYTKAHTSGAQMDSLVAGEGFRLRLCRNDSSVSGVVEVARVSVLEP